MGDKLIKTQNLYSLLDLELFLMIIGTGLFAWFFYRTFLKQVTDERHRNINNYLKNILHHCLVFSVLFFVYLILYEFLKGVVFFNRFLPYIGIACFSWGAFVFIKSCRLILLQYMFLGSMKAGVPVLIVNIFSLILTIGIAIWGSIHLFGIQVAPLLATSAAFSVIMGLAMQDTLGNLFAGISLQIDKSFEIGDWLEVNINSQKVVGMVREITWRSTILLGWADEIVIIPNRMLANAHISNFAGREMPILRSQIFRLPYGTDLEVARQALLESLSENNRVRKTPPPLCLVTESAESWLTVKLIYYLDNFGSQYIIGDIIIEQALLNLKKHGIFTASPTIGIHKISELKEG